MRLVLAGALVALTASPLETAAATAPLNAPTLRPPPKRPLNLKLDPRSVLRRVALVTPVPTPERRPPVDDPDLVPKAGASLELTTAGTVQRDSEVTALANEQSRALRNYLDELGLQQVSIRYTARF